MSRRRIGTKVIFLIFGLCAAVDFGLGHHRGHSAIGGAVYTVLGLPFTALLFFFLGVFRKDKEGG